MISKKQTTTVLVAVLALPLSTNAWVAPSLSRPLLPTTRHYHHSRTTQLFAGNNKNNGGGPLDFLFNPYESKIPDDLKDEIYAAEARTPTAQERGGRVALYAVVAFVGIVLAFFSAFVTELRNTPLPPGEIGDPLAIAGFTWVRSNFLLEFLFTNKLGGGLCLLVGAGSGLMAEAELDTKRINAEKIFDEMERRREKKQKPAGAAKRKGKKRRPGKEKKRMEALSELVLEERKAKDTEQEIATDGQADNSEQTEKAEEAPKHEDEGIMGKMKGFYDKADNMAASQALLLNKKLEEEGLVEKITDETGLNVIGRDEAAKLQQDKMQGEEKKPKSK